MTRLYFPICDNGMGLSRTRWALSMMDACLNVLQDYEVTLDSISYPYPDGGSNIFTQNFLESDADEMIVIDTDVVFTTRDLTLLLSHDVPLVFGIYPKKVLGLEFPMIPMDGDANAFADDGRPPLREVQCCARGFMRAKREVFEKLKTCVVGYTDAQTGRFQYEFWRNQLGGHSDDFNFCNLWRSIGGKVMVDTRIACQHEGSALYPIKGTY